MTNPSNITITVGDINFDVKLPSAGDAVIGKAYLNNATIAPGPQSYPSEMHLGEGVTDANGVIALGEILTAYLTGASVPLLVAGSATSTTIAPIQPGIAALQLQTTMNGNTQGLIQSVHVTTSMTDVAVSAIAYADITLFNPLAVPFTIKHIYAETYHWFLCEGDLSAGVDTSGLTNTNYLLGTIDMDVDVTIPAGGSYTGTNWLVSLTHDDPLYLFYALDASVFDGNFYYNITQNASVIVGDSFAVENMYYYQQEVPYTVNVSDLSETVFTTYQPILCTNFVGLFNYSDLAGYTVSAASINTTNTTTTTNTTNATTTATTTTTAASSTVSLTTIDTTTTTTDVITTTVDAVTTTTDAAATTTDAATTTTDAAATTV